jgi:uncharacterized protein YndB with AHSA1/START domain
MRYFEATSVIAARPEAVWPVLSDAAAWPGWDSGIDAVAGRIAEGEIIKEHADPLLPLTWGSMPGQGPSFQRLAVGLKQRAGSGH